MRFRICWTKNGINDWIIVEGETISDIRKKADIEMKKRDPDNYWSEELQC